ncbi:uncharacterized protein LOC143599494 [Bidens hawaiensis]|uniref:uncharacterized protein LOC143599494 n=1 Tax=Bidens hawaiensis TaxID=980011 RepID=UPI0040495772
MEEIINIMLWHGGTIKDSPKFRYVGGDSTIVRLDIDKASYFELIDYVMKTGCFKSKDFYMYCLIPGVGGLRPLVNDFDVIDIIKMEGSEDEISSDDSGSDDEVNIFHGEDDYDTEFENEEWIDSVAAIQQVDKEDVVLKNSLLKQCLNGSKDAKENMVEYFEGNFVESFEAGGSHLEAYSSYEDSDGYVNSPGESEDDNVRGKKYKQKVPVVYSLQGDAFKQAVRKYAVINGRNVYISISDKKRLGRLGVNCVKGCPFYLFSSFHKVFKAKPHWSAIDIQSAVKEKYKVLIERWFAYKAKSYAHRMLHGSMRDHYSQIASYVASLKDANPSSTFELRGFLAGCKKVLCLDGCFLKTFLGDMLLAAIGRDGNDQMYPLAWAVVEGETNDSWEWFMDQLGRCLDINDGGNGWTLISDQQKGLVNSVSLVWKKAEHRIVQDTYLLTGKRRTKVKI